MSGRVRDTFSLGGTTELVRISKHVVQCHLGDRRELFFADFAIGDRPTPCIQSTDDSACVWTKDEGSMINGQWTMDNRQWTMEYGIWNMDNDQWTVDNGQWID
jgi:hypothetical protein